MKKRAISPHKIWLAFFALWALFLSGVFNSFFGPPGAIQAFRLSRLLNSKQVRLAVLEEDQVKIEEESLRLEKSRLAQEREIRKTLGYAGKDEIIFDFTSTHQSAPRR